ncbi:PrsW family intramembrane metalloprotease [Leptospira ognonensis]|uniref:PrsW family intramembrane metalloprotease n=1 Tax=Leptospira ognonensis TaxID=2484945 RepID=A0A4R9JWR6_9LEPT|nr:PrsW family glutamic-type intramembrane protease [Leptospira ognonensis]TGL57474.1 PrsW family intramembrane metalloprotease [Leptospira ognonensis]
MATFFSFSNILILAINVATLGFYYTFYRFHFYRFTESFLQYTAFSFSVFSAGVALAIQATILILIPYPSYEFKALILSSSVEELSKLLGIYIFFRKNQDEFTVTDGIFYGLVLGGGFGLLENILYFIDTGLWSQVLRSISALPIHMINGGLAGAFLMIFLFSGHGFIRWIRLIFGMSICISLHAFYNYSLFIDANILLVLPLCILSLFFLLEITIAKSRILLPGYVLKLMNMTVEEYEIISRHNRHEGWIQNVQKHISTSSVKLLKIPNLRHIIITIFFLIPSILSAALLIYDPVIITKMFVDLELKDYFALFIIYPAVLGFMFFFAGVLNPYFFRDRMLAVPLFGSVDLKTERSEENTALFHIYWNKFFIPVSKVYPENTPAIFDFWIGIKQYAKLKGKILWVKEGEEGNCGAMCELEEIPFRFLIHWNLVRLRQNFKNLLIRNRYI